MTHDLRDRLKQIPEENEEIYQSVASAHGQQAAKAIALLSYQVRLMVGATLLSRSTDDDPALACDCVDLTTDALAAALATALLPWRNDEAMHAALMLFATSCMRRSLDDVTAMFAAPNS